MICCYCAEPLREGDSITRAQRIAYLPVDDPDVQTIAVVKDDWGHLGCWRLALRQAEEDALRRLEQKRARFAPRGV